MLVTIINHHVDHIYKSNRYVGLNHNRHLHACYNHKRNHLVGYDQISNEDIWPSSVDGGDGYFIHF